jgi:hypothetical protein
MNYRLDYIEQLENENRGLVGEMYECAPHSDQWLKLRNEVRANNEEIEIMKQVEGASNE